MGENAAMTYLGIWNPYLKILPWSPSLKLSQVVSSTNKKKLNDDVIVQKTT